MKKNIGMWIAIGGGVIGIIIAIVSVLATTGQEGIYIAAGILVIGLGMGLLFYKLLIGPMMLASRLQETGIPGTALIKELHDTGVTVNNSPQIKLVLEVKNSFGQKYTTTIRTLVSRLQPQLYQPGMTIPVLIDPKDEKKLVINYNKDRKQSRSNYTNNNFNFNNVQESQLKDEMLQTQQQGDAIRLTGKSARAIVKNYTWLGVYVNGNNPYAEIEVEVLPDDKPAFAAKLKAAISEKSVSKYQPGKEIFVKYDAYDFSKVAVDHS